jgi:hypothetical protein
MFMMAATDFAQALTIKFRQRRRHFGKEQKEFAQVKQHVVKIVTSNANKR